MAGQEVIDVAHNAHAAVSGIGMNAALPSVHTGIAGIFGVNVFTDDIAVIVKGIDGLDHLVIALTFVRIHLLSRLNNRSAGGCRIGVGGLVA